MQRFTELRVWRRSHLLALGVYRTTAAFPAEERFGLTQQIRRAAVSVVANIAEGSLAETEALLRLAKDLWHELPSNRFDELIDESEQISRMLHALRSAL